MGDGPECLTTRSYSSDGRCPRIAYIQEVIEAMGDVPGSRNYKKLACVQGQRDAVDIDLGPPPGLNGCPKTA